MGVDEIEIDFTKLQPGLIALTGRNGSGKTTIMENLHPYRTMVSRDGSLQSHFFLKDSYRILEFEYDGRFYKSQILIDALTGGSEAYLFTGEDDEDALALNDGKVTTYDEEIEKLLGSQELFFNSVFSGQKSKGIAELKPAERRKLFYELLNLDSYEKYLERAKAELKKEELALAEVEGQIKAIGEISPSLIDELRNDEAQLAANVLALIEERKHITSQIEELQSIINDADVQIGIAEKKLADQFLLKDEIKSYEKTIENIANEHNKKVFRLNSDITDSEQLIKKYENIVLLKDEILEGLNSIADYEKSVKLFVEDRTHLISKKADLQEAYSKSYAALSEKESGLKSKRDEHQKLNWALSQIKDSISRAIKDSELISNVPCDENTGQSCKFLSNAYESKNKLEQLQKQEANLLHSFNDFAEQLSHIEKEIISEKNLLDEKFSVERGSISVKLDQIEAVIRDEQKIVSDLKSKQYEEKKKQLDAAEKNIAVLTEKINSCKILIESEKNSIQDQIKHIEDSIVATKKEIDDSLADYINSLKSSKDQVYKQLKDYELKRDAVCFEIDAEKNQIADINNQISLIEKNLTLSMELTAKKSSIQTEIQDWTFLCKAFDKTGIPVLKLENSGVEITNIANELLSLFENKFRIVFETTSLTKDKKKQKETFDINIVEEDGVCEIGNKSGGQQVWLETAIQLAISLVVRKQGRNIETSFLDEKDGALDLDNAYSYIEMLKKAHEMSGVYNTFIITHRTELLDFIPQQVKLTNGILEVIS